MKKIFYTLLVLFVGIIQTVDAQQEASSIIEWNGKNKRLMMRADSLLTFSYKATENGTLYIYSDDQNVSDNMHVSIWGGWYHDGAYDADSPLQEAGSYENGVGIYAWIKVLAGDEIRFTLSTPEEAEGIMAIFTLKSLFFGEDVKGDSWEALIYLKELKPVIPPLARQTEISTGAVKFRIPFTFGTKEQRAANSLCSPLTLTISRYPCFRRKSEAFSSASSSE